jgi:hypothetical protein
VVLNSPTTWIESQKLGELFAREVQIRMNRKFEEEGVVVETTGALVQDIFGVGGERHGTLEWIDNNSDVLSAGDITEDHRERVDTVLRIIYRVI